MSEKYFDRNGFYEPHWFHMFISNFEETTLDFDKCDHRQLGLYAHEYTHYLQNILTISGVRNANDYYKFIYRIRQKLGSETKVALPLGDGFMSDSDRIRKRKFDLLKGDDFIGNRRFNKIDTSVHKQELDEKEYEILRVNFYDEDIPESIGYIELGSLCVKEGMSRAVQKEFDPDVDQLFYPYKITELLVKHYCPSIEDENTSIAALSSLALNFENSGLHFLRLLEEYNVFSGKLSEFIMAELNDKKLIVNGKPGGSLKELFLESVEELRVTLSGFLSSELTYLNDLIENIDSTARNYGLVFYDVLNNSTFSDSQKLDELKAFYGVPAIQLDSGTLIFPFANVDTEISPELVELMSVKALANRLFESEGGTICRFYPFCMNAPDDNTDENCDSTQWLRKVNCPMLQVINYWNLVDKLELR